MPPKISIIIANWNNFEDTAECLESVGRIDYPDKDVIVIDNGSSDSSCRQSIKHFPQVTVLQNSLNLGLAAANNAGIRRALSNRAEFGLLLNNDTEVEPSILKNFVQAAARHPGAGIFGAKIYYDQDRNRIWSAIPRWDPQTAQFSHEGMDRLDDGKSYTDEVPLAYANGCALFFRMGVVERIGYFDERFFVYYEEIDWCFRARKAGYEIVFVPSAVLWHKVSRSHFGKKSLVVEYLEGRNQFLWAQKNLAAQERKKFARNAQRWLLPSLSFDPSPVLKRMYWDALFLLSPIGQARLRGLVDYYLGRFGACPEDIRRAAQRQGAKSKKRILFLIRNFEFPVNCGWKIRTWNFIQALCGKFDVFLVNIYSQSRAEPFLPPAGIFRRVWNIPQDLSRRRLPLFWRIWLFLIGIPWEMSHTDAFVKNTLAAILKRGDWDMIFTRYLDTANFAFESCPGLRGKMIIDLDDLETRKNLRQITREGFRSTYDLIRKHLNILAYERYHRRHLRRVAACLVCSSDDQQFIKHKRWCRNIHVIPNAISIAHGPLPAPQDRRTVLFVGMLDYTPNVDGLKWFIREVWPKILQHDGDIQFIIVGKGRKSTLIPLEDAPRIQIRSNVPEVYSYYAQAAVAVVPIWIAGGTRIKILEAALLGRPVVSTTIGAEGLGLRHMEHALIADSPQDMADAVISILRNPDLARKLAEAGYNFVKNNFDPDRIFEKIRNVFQEGETRA